VGEVTKTHITDYIAEFASEPKAGATALVTDPYRRRLAAAAALLAAVEEVARATGCEQLEVTTRPRDDAFAFYLDAGFEERPRRLVRSVA